MNKASGITTCYKVFARTKDGRLMSAVITSVGLAVEYRRNHWSCAKVGGILCFRTKADAMAFAEELWLRRASRGCSHEVWEVVARGRLRLPVYSISHPTVPMCRNLWDGKITDTMFPFLSYWPDRTLAYRKVKPVRFLKSHLNIW